MLDVECSLLNQRISITSPGSSGTATPFSKTFASSFALSPWRVMMICLRLVRIEIICRGDGLGERQAGHPRHLRILHRSATVTPENCAACCCRNAAFCPARKASCAFACAADFVVQPASSAAAEIESAETKTVFPRRFISLRLLQDFPEAGFVRLDFNPVDFASRRMREADWAKNSLCRF